MINSQLNHSQAEQPRKQQPVGSTDQPRALSPDELSMVAGGPTIDNQPT